MKFSDSIVYRIFSKDREFDKADGRKTLAFVIYSDSAFIDLLDYLEDLFVRFNPYEIVLEAESGRYDRKELLRLYPSITIVEFMQRPTLSRLMNKALEVLDSRYFIFASTGMEIRHGDFDEFLGIFGSYKCPVAIAPLIYDCDGHAIPSARGPGRHRMEMIVDVLPNLWRIQDTLYPLKGCAVYDAELVKKVGAFDESLTDDYYSLVDFSLRAWLSAFSILIYDRFQVKAFSPDGLIERIRKNHDSTIVNFRAMFLYRRENAMMQFSPFTSFVFARDEGYSGFRDVIDNFSIDYDTLVKRWRVGENEEIL